jgi:hypothetical protein
MDFMVNERMTCEERTQAHVKDQSRTRIRRFKEGWKIIFGGA